MTGYCALCLRPSDGDGEVEPGLIYDPAKGYRTALRCRDRKACEARREPEPAPEQIDEDNEW